jgi:hypothetical protein
LVPAARRHGARRAGQHRGPGLCAVPGARRAARRAADARAGTTQALSEQLEQLEKTSAMVVVSLTAQMDQILARAGARRDGGG